MSIDFLNIKNPWKPHFPNEMTINHQFLASSKPLDAGSAKSTWDRSTVGQHWVSKKTDQSVWAYVFYTCRVYTTHIDLLYLIILHI